MSLYKHISVKNIKKQLFLQNKIRKLKYGFGYNQKWKGVGRAETRGRWVVLCHPSRSMNILWCLNSAIPWYSNDTNYLQLCLINPQEKSWRNWIRLKNTQYPMKWSGSLKCFDCANLNLKNITNFHVNYRPVVQEDDVVSQSGADNSHTELSILEKDCCKQNF